MIKKRKSCVSYTKWGYIFLIPFFLVYVIFSLIPLVSVFYNSLFENYRSGLNQIGPNFTGLNNFKILLSNKDLLTFAKNTIIVWLIGFIPQILISLLLAAWFANTRLRIRNAGFFKAVIYMPNLIMASAFAMLFFTLFSDNGPVNDLLVKLGILDEPFRFLASVEGTRGLIASMNFLMWFGNTTILLMAGIMGIDSTLFEAAEVDGASQFQAFRLITMPLLRPILLYVLMTSMIGGIQMFDVPQILTNGSGNPNSISKT
ncbi:MAG: sugar ABC transporter permease, partial [Clostridiales bacterium]|nr:sugar ABC transporter permease [Clostridiales bacterium]